tara:strand:+ start:1403 stop:1645 length:243 start_codon:yes stop_codon:yes gene_type:complete
MTKEWINTDDLFDTDGEYTTQKWNVSITMDSPDGITQSRLTKVISAALRDSNYLYGEVKDTEVSAKLESAETNMIQDLHA